MSHTYVLDVDDSEARAKLRNLEQVSKQTFRNTVQTTRRVTQGLIYLARASGIALEESLAAAIEATLLTIETGTDLVAMESLTGWGLLRAGARVALIAQLWRRVAQMQKGQSEIAGQTAASIEMLRLMTF